MVHLQGLVDPLDKAIGKEDDLQKDAADVIGQLDNVKQQLDNLDKKNPNSAPILADIAETLRGLAPKVDEVDTKLKTEAPLVAHGNVPQDIPATFADLQKLCDDSKKKIDDVVQLNAVAPEIELIREQLTQQPVEIPAALPEQQAALDDLVEKKQKLENLLAAVPENEDTEELREKSMWDLSRLKDLLKQLGDAVGDKMAALAAFNATRKDVEDKLLDITKDKDDESSADPKNIAALIDSLKKDEEALAALKKKVDDVDPSQLDAEHAKEHDDLLKQIAKAADILTDKRNKLQSALDNANALEKNRAEAAAVQNDLAELVKEAQRLLSDPEAIPDSFAPMSDNLKKATDAARDVVKNSPNADDDIVRALADTVVAADDVIPQIDDRTKNWNEFVAAREDGDNKLAELQKPLDVIAEKPLRPLDKAVKDLAEIQEAAKGVDTLKDAMKNLQRLSELLDPLECAYADVRFFDVDVEQTEQQFEDLLNGLLAETEDEKLIGDSAKTIDDEIDRINDFLAQNPDKSAVENLESTQLPPILAQLALLDDKSQAPRSHVAHDPDALNNLHKKIDDLKKNIDDAKKKADEEAKDQLLLVLTLKLDKLNDMPLNELSPEELDALKDELEKLPTDDKIKAQLARLDDLQKKKTEEDAKLDALQKAIDEIKKDSDNVAEKIKPTAAPKGKKSKGKKKPAAGDDSDNTLPVDELKKELDHVTNDILPAIEKLAAEPINAPAEKTKLDELKKAAEDLASTIDKQIKDKEAAEQAAAAEEQKKKNAEDKLDKAVNDVDALVAKYNQPQPIDIAKNDADILKDLAKEITDLPLADLQDAKPLLDKANSIKNKIKVRGLLIFKYIFLCDA